MAECGNDRDLQDFAQEMGEEDKLCFLEKALCVTTGPIVGMLPPPLQMKITGDNFEAAALMSKTSRIFNGVVVPIYAGGSLIARGLGYDIDPTPGDVMPWIGLGSAIDSGIREVFHGVAYVFNHPYVEHLKVWGEPVVSILYSSIFEREKKESRTDAA